MWYKDPYYSNKKIWFAVILSDIIIKFNSWFTYVLTQQPKYQLQSKLVQKKKTEQTHEHKQKTKKGKEMPSSEPLCSEQRYIYTE
jgi:hypothetical protein